ncbi:MAG: DUF3332 domain-containing protein [Salibacteraceae bacterium]
MKKKIFSIFLIPMMLFIGIIQTSCFGSFGLVKTVYEFNDSVVENEFIKSFVFWIFCIIPVYEFAGFVDVFFLNVLEFWTGSNPVAMSEGDRESQVIAYQNKTYEVIATKNQFEIKELGEEGQVLQGSKLEFCEADKSWTYINGSTIKMISKFKGFDEDNRAVIEYYADQGVKEVRFSREAIYQGI